METVIGNIIVQDLKLAGKSEPLWQDSTEQFVRFWEAHSQ